MTPVRVPGCLLVVAIIAVLAATPAAAQSLAPHIAGVVVDTSGACVPGALVGLIVPGQRRAETTTDAAGRFVFHGVPAGPASVIVSLRGFAPATLDIPQTARLAVTIVLQPLAVAESLTVTADRPGMARPAAALKTDTPLLDTPQAVTVVTRDVMASQGMRSLADVVRAVPGAGAAQGEGNRDAAVLRGQSTSGDFFVDGVRDDVQYYRDLYNVDRIEALKGPNSLLFGRGGAGGILNRVTRQATWTPVRELTVQGGSYDDRRVTADLGQPLTRTVAGRVTAVYERSDSYRRDVGLERFGVNPTIAVALGGGTLLTGGYEHFADDRTADRGVPSDQGRPLDVPPGTFFGDPSESRSRARVDAYSAAVEHRLGAGAVLKGHLRYAAYDKFYQNVYPGAVGDERVSLSAYNHATKRGNLLGQADLTARLVTGRLQHTVLVGVEAGRQVTDNARNTGYFDGIDSVFPVPLSSPTVAVPVVFRRSATDADNHGVATTVSAYVQDQVDLGRVQFIAGGRYEDFRVNLRDNRSARNLASHDALLSPRAGVVFKPRPRVSLYSSFSLAYLPRAGEQLSSLSPTNQALEPEQFRNYEAGAKWEAARSLSITAAVYRLERHNVAVADAADPTRLVLVDGQRASGVELGMSGRVAGAWQVIAAYAWQRGEITHSLSATAQAGARLALLPAHSLSVWNRWDWSASLGAGVGVIRRGAVFTSTDNSVALPGYTRLDVAVFAAIGRRLRAQANLENVLDTRYFPTANGNNNITPGSPRAVRVSVTTLF